MDTPALSSSRGAGLPARLPGVWGGFWSIAYVAATLLALAGLPYLVDRRVAEVEREITTVLEPARELASDLVLAQARQMLPFQEYLLTGDGGARTRYQGLIADEGDIMARLEALLEHMDLRVQAQVLPTVNASSEWHLGHREALAGEEARRSLLSRSDEDRVRYDAMLRAAEELRGALADEARRGRERMESVRRLQTGLTMGLVALALLATAAVGLLGRRLRTLVREAHQRRREAVRARWEVDAVLEATGDGVMSLDLQGRATSLNGAGTRLLGYSEEDARGRSAHELVHGRKPGGEGCPREEDCPLMEAVRLGVVEDGRDDTAHHRRGQALPVRWSLRPLMDGRTVKGAVLTLTDMTEVRAAEEALRRAVKAREETLAVVSHDLRNPLGSVTAAAELLLELPLPEERRRQHLEVIRRAGERMHRLIQDLLDLSRIDGGGLAVRPQTCRVDALLAEAADLAGPRARERGVAVEVQPMPGGDGAALEAWADRDRILQVLGNLLSNAIRHTPPGGHVTLSVEADPAAPLTLCVSDTGEGVPERDRAHLFDRFWRPDRSGRAGAGLGLAIVKGIVEAHGGEVWMESVVGEGSTFRFTLPRRGPASG